MRTLWKGIGAGLAVSFIAAFGWFTLINEWKLALWCLGASIVAMAVALILARPEDDTVM